MYTGTKYPDLHLVVIYKLTYELMNWKTIDESWKEFANDNDLTLEQSENNFFYGVRTEYKLSIQNNDQKITLIGDLKKITYWCNRYRTKLFIHNLSSNSLTFNEVVDKRIFGLFKNSYKDGHKSDLLGLIRKFGAEKLINKHGELEAQFDYVFGKHTDFQNSLQLANKLIECASNLR
jgi:hypothetical protein